MNELVAKLRDNIIALAFDEGPAKAEYLKRCFALLDYLKNSKKEDNTDA